MNLKIQASKLQQFCKQNGLFKTIIRIASRIFCPSKHRKVQKEIENYKLWIKNNEPNEEELEKQKTHIFEYTPKISVIVPMYNTKEKYLSELIDSLINQTYSNWELCLADGSDEEKEYVKVLTKKDNRIKYKFLNSNNGISENSNEALKLATGDFIALLDHDDILPRFSLYEIVKAINENRDVEFIYSDEDKILEEKENRIDPHFKQDYAPDTLMSYNYICHFSVFKKSLIDKLGGFRKEFDGSQDYDLIFRAVEQTNKIIHIPKILYHWRINEGSVAFSSDTKPYAYETGKKAILAHLKRMNIEATVEDIFNLGTYQVSYKVKENPKVSIIIQNKNNKRNLDKCIKSILKNTLYDNYEIIIVDNNSQTKEIFKYYKKIEQNEKIKIIKVKQEDFNYSKLNNFGVTHSNGNYIVFLNSNIEIITSNWIETMLGNCQREDVGIVSAKLLFKNMKVKHAGVVLGLSGTIGYVNLGLNENELGYMSRNVISQNYSAVAGEMIMISKKDYEDINGFDEEFSLEYNDIDLCLKIRNKGKVIVMNPFVKGYSLKSKIAKNKISEEKIERLQKDEERLKDKWKQFFEKEDPYFNINFKHNILKIEVNPEKL